MKPIPSSLASVALALALAVSACAPAAPAAAPVAQVDGVTLTSADGAASPFKDVASKSPYTVFVFIAAECPCLDAHLDRLRALSAKYGPRGVAFYAVDSEVGGSPERAKAEAEKFSLPFPVLVDPGAKLANAVGAEYATYSVVMDREGKVLYRGGIDNDKRKLHDDATPYVSDALEDLLASKPVRRAEGKALGCSLRKW